MFKKRKKPKWKPSSASLMTDKELMEEYLGTTLAPTQHAEWYSFTVPKIDVSIEDLQSFLTPHETSVLWPLQPGIYETDSGVLGTSATATVVPAPSGCSCGTCAAYADDPVVEVTCDPLFDGSNLRGRQPLVESSVDLLLAAVPEPERESVLYLVGRAKKLPASEIAALRRTPFTALPYELKELAVYAYNDNLDSAEAAAEWFERALELTL